MGKKIARPTPGDDGAAPPGLTESGDAVIEGDETHTRTADLSLDLASVPGFSKAQLDSLTDTVVRAPVTQAVIYGWYDNEMGFSHRMLDLAVYMGSK